MKRQMFAQTRRFAHALSKVLLAALLCFAAPLLAGTWVDPDTRIPWAYSETLDDGTSIRPEANLSGRIVIPAVVAGRRVTEIDSRAFANNTDLTSVTIPEGVEVIKHEAFEGCTGLTSVTLPNSLGGIWLRAFAGCTALTSIDLPDGLQTIMSEAFAGCTGLDAVTIPASVEMIHSQAFTNCGAVFV